MKSLVEKAEDFAVTAHESINHRRKYSNDPYHVHPQRVAHLVASVTNDEEVIAAAWLHDVLEDVAPQNPAFDEAAIRQVFGERVLKLVLEVTDVSKLQDGNRARRKEIDRQHLACVSDEGKTIKLADIIDNLIDISQHDPGFARIFRSEARLDLPCLESGHKLLYERLLKLLEEV